jgi:endonuclease/exonuclease/phosphatase family metal-dependent hydrolase
MRHIGLNDYGNRLGFMMVSWHGRWKGAQQRRNEFVDLCTLISKIAEILNLPFLIAGDFNIDSTVVEKLIEEFYYLIPIWDDI